jgi:hypothetical protein
VNRAGGRSGSLRNIGRIEQWNVGSGAWAAVAVDASERPQWVWIAELRQSRDERLGRADPRPSCPRPGTLERVSSTHSATVSRGRPSCIRTTIAAG